NIAVEQVLRARPDGYTLTVGNVGTFVLNPHTMQGVNFDPLDLVPIGSNSGLRSMKGRVR
ncbi:MAG: hypothetical protein ACKO54_00485, partial [Alphaproteobacteria bacterium]